MAALTPLLFFRPSIFSVVDALAVPGLSKAAGATADAQGLQLTASLPGPGGYSPVPRLWERWEPG